MFDEDEQTMMVPSFSPGTFFADRYRIQELLGSGAMGRVYRAEELGPGRTVALKVLHSERLADAETVARFRREADVLASIGHPCIVAVHTFHQSREGIPYLAMELLEGTTLKTRLQAGRFEDPAELQEIVDGICGALAAAHARGVVHRDLKPDNIFLPASGAPRAKLVDFGLSRIAKSDKSLTHSGMILGTPRYMAPEQIRDASAAGPAGDLYSLAVILYEALAGASPYPAEDYGQLLGCLMEGRTTPFTERRPDLPALAPVLTRGLSSDPGARFASAARFADAYGEAIGRPSRREEIARQAPTPSSSRPPRMSSPSPVPSRSSTLAFDPSAGGEFIAALEAREAEESMGARPRDDLAATDPDRPAGLSGGLPEAAEVAPALPGPAASAVPVTSSSSARGRPPPPEAATAQGGDTLFLGDSPVLTPPPAASAPSAPPYPAARPPSDPSFASAPDGASPLRPPPPTAAPSYATPGSSPPHPSPPHPSPPHPSPQGPAPSFPSAPVSSPPGLASPSAPPRRSPRRALAVALFLIAVVVVVVVSAAGGLALRAYLSTS